MITVSVHEAKTHMSRLLARVEAGEEITIARGKTPIAKLVKLAAEPRAKRQLGWLSHHIPPSVDPLANGFWDALPDDHLGL